MTRAELKETLRNIMKEESDYQVFFKKALEKAGKSITDMSDDEKKAFFNKIDAAWDGKGEKNEGNAFGAAVTAAKEKGEDEFEVGGKTYKVEEGKKRFNTKYGVGSSKYVVSYHDGKKKHNDGSDFFDVQIFRNQKDLDTFKKALLQKGFIEESVTEEKYPTAVEKFNKELIKHPMVKKAAQFYKKTPAEIVKVLQQRLYSKGDKTGNTKEVWIDFKDTTSGIQIKHKMKFNESVNESIAVGKMVKIVDNPHWEAAFGKKGPFKRKVKMIDGDNVFFTDGSNSSMKYVKESVESVNEGRAFINAAKKAKAEGKTEFEFNGKTYPVTLKEGTLNEMNPQLNKGVKSLLDKELKDLRKGGSNHLFAVMNVLMGALTDANFHSESKKVPAIFGSKAKYEGDPMAKRDMENLYQSLGERIATMAKWDGEDIAKAVGFYVSMSIGRPLGQKIENLV